MKSNITFTLTFSVALLISVDTWTGVGAVVINTRGVGEGGARIVVSFTLVHICSNKKFMAHFFQLKDYSCDTVIQITYNYQQLIIK